MLLTCWPYVKLDPGPIHNWNTDGNSKYRLAVASGLHEVARKTTLFLSRFLSTCRGNSNAFQQRSDLGLQN